MSIVRAGGIEMVAGDEEVAEAEVPSSGRPEGFDRWKTNIAKGVGVTAGVSWTGYLVYQHRWAEAGGAFGTFVLLALVLRPIGRFLNSFFGHAEERLSRGADRLGERAVDEIVRLLQKGGEALFAHFYHAYCKDLEFTLRTYRTQGLQQSGPFTLDLEHVYVPLRISPNSPSRISANLVAAGSAQDTQQIWDFLSDQSDDAPRRLALLARPGAGKTTLLEHLTLTFARGTQRRIHRNAPGLVPILFYLRDIRKQLTQENPPHLVELLNSTLRQRKNVAHDLTPPQEWFEGRLTANRSRCLVMFDGLDEVADDDERQAVCRWVDQQMQRYPEARFLITSRPQGYTTAPCKHIEVVLEVQPFSMSEVRSFTANWFLQNEVMRQRRHKDAGVVIAARKKSQALMAEIEQSSVLTELAVNPLLLTMITTVRDSQGAVPESRVALYKEICEVLLVRRQRDKGLTDELSALKKQTLLQRLALNLMKSGTRNFTADQGEQWLTVALREVAGANVSVMDFIKSVARRSGLLVEREQGQYEFGHKSIQEYLAAIEVKETKQEVLLVSHMGETWWEETIRLYAAQSDTGPFIQAALDTPTVSKLTLAYDCLIEGLRTPSELREKLEQKLEEALESKYPEEAQLAAEVKLARRLRSMIRIEEGIRIDSALISCAEYQLFVSLRPEFAPHHWRDCHFPRGRASLPVSGLWPEAAEAFCLWLAQRESSLNGYRLPMRLESETIPMWNESGSEPQPNGNIGHWCTDDGKLCLIGLSPLQLQRELRSLSIPAKVLDVLVGSHDANSAIPAPSEIEKQAITLASMESETLQRLDFSMVWLQAACLGPGSECKTNLLGHLAFIPMQREVCLLSQALVNGLAKTLAGTKDQSDATNQDGHVEIACELQRALEVDLSVLNLPPEIDRGLPRAVALGVVQNIVRTRDISINLKMARDLEVALRRDLNLECARARDLARDLAPDCGPGFHFELEPELDGSVGLLLGPGNQMAELWRVYQYEVRHSERLPGTHLPMKVLGSLLNLARQYSTLAANVVSVAVKARDHRLRIGKTKADCERLAKYCVLRAQSLERLSAWATLYAAREQTRYPGWEGLRIVCDTRSVEATTSTKE